MPLALVLEELGWYTKLVGMYIEVSVSVPVARIDVGAGGVDVVVGLSTAAVETELVAVADGWYVRLAGEYVPVVDTLAEDSVTEAAVPDAVAVEESRVPVVPVVRGMDVETVEPEDATPVPEYAEADTEVPDEVTGTGTAVVPSVPVDVLSV
jgi:hypothetical protein